mgnify:CR=1 FL=1
MKKNLNYFFTFTFIFLISSCGGKNNDNFDFSSFKKPVKEIQLEEKKSLEIEEQKPVKYKLKKLKEREEILSSIRFGKIDPFSSSEGSTTLSEIKLKGFISIKNKNYAVLNYLEKDGIINIESVGSINTFLLPEGALITEINPIEEYIKISHRDEISVLELTNKGGL